MLVGLLIDLKFCFPTVKYGFDMVLESFTGQNTPKWEDLVAAWKLRRQILEWPLGIYLFNPLKVRSCDKLYLSLGLLFV